jgi:hypothetical protein
MIPAWLKRARDDGTAHRAVTLRLCPRCRAPVLTGLDAEWCAISTQCDPTPLTPLGEAVALLSGRQTYTLTPGRNRKELDYRDEWRIAKPTKNPVLAEHKCGALNLSAFAAPPPERKATIGEHPEY